VAWHREWANQLYAANAKGQNLKKLMAIVGEDALTELDKRYLKFSNAFERYMLGQGESARIIEDTLALGWKLMGLLPKSELTRIKREIVDQYYSEVTDIDTAPNVSVVIENAG
jgi:V/A-type H+-transporting ATPase subunit B